MDIKEIIKNLELIIGVTPDYVQGRRRGLTDDETEKLAYRAVYQAAEILEKLVSTEGWKKKLVDGEWEHYCPECQESEGKEVADC